jgi:hypothetical protein
MGYRPENQALNAPIEKILEGFEDFDSAVKKRTESNEWSEEHIIKLNEFRKKFFDLQFELEALNRETW